MPYQKEFDEKGRMQVWETEQKPTDMFRIQSAMFKDRPDLWPTKKRRAHRPVKVQPGQLKLEEEIDHGNDIT